MRAFLALSEGERVLSECRRVVHTDEGNRRGVHSVVRLAVRGNQAERRSVLVAVVDQIHMRRGHVRQREAADVRSPWQWR